MHLRDTSSVMFRHDEATFLIIVPSVIDAHAAPTSMIKLCTCVLAVAEWRVSRVDREDVTV